MAAREMNITLDNSQHITVNTLNIEALSSIQLQANCYVDRIKLEAAQALGSAEAVFNRMSTAHEAERQGWNTAFNDFQQRLRAECCQQVAAANASGNEQLLRLRTDGE